MPPCRRIFPSGEAGVAHFADVDKTRARSYIFGAFTDPDERLSPLATGDTSK